MAQQEDSKQNTIQWAVQFVLGMVVIIVVRWYFDWPRLPGVTNNPKATSKFENHLKSEFDSIAYHWDELSLQEKQRLTPARNAFIRYAVDSFLNRSKADWNALDEKQQIRDCETVESSLVSVGYTKAEAGGFSLFIGPFMDSSPPQATVKDAIGQYKSRLDQQRTQRGLAAIEKAFDFALTAAQISQAMQQQQ